MRAAKQSKEKWLDKVEDYCEAHLYKFFHFEGPDNRKKGNVSDSFKTDPTVLCISMIGFCIFAAVKNALIDIVGPQIAKSFFNKASDVVKHWKILHFGWKRSCKLSN